MIDWQDIGTASKEATPTTNGPIVLLHGHDASGRKWTTIGAWDLDAYAKKPGPYFRCRDIDFMGLRYQRAMTWTHWAPLTPPEGK